MLLTIKIKSLIKIIKIKETKHKSLFFVQPIIVQYVNFFNQKQYHKKKENKESNPPIKFRTSIKRKKIPNSQIQKSQTKVNVSNHPLKKDSLEVIERHPHSNYVAYVPKGKDASVNYGTADFKFKNNSNVPIKIHTKLDGKNVVVEIYELK